MHLKKLIISSLIAVASVFGATQSLYALATNGAGDKCFVLVVDPGHGGHDVGAAEHGQQEKDINLAVSKALASLVKKNLKDVKVVMTRDDDSYLTLQQRADKANKSKGDLFISIHTNSVDKSNKNRSAVSGASVYTLGLHKDNNNMEVARRENSVIELESNYTQRYSGFDPSKDESYIIFEMAQKKNLHNSIRFARNAQHELVTHAGRKDRNVRQAGFWVLWATSMPSVLVELDFVCNPDQAVYLGSEKGVKQLSEALFNAVKDYVAGFGTDLISHTETESNSQTTSQSEAPLTASTAPVAAAAPRTVVAAPPRNNTARQEYAQRRRRSAAGRQKSESRNLQTTDIPLQKTENESVAAVSQSKPEPTLSAKEREKQEKAARKAAEKARKQAEKEAEKARKQAEKEAKRNKQSKTKAVQHFRTVYKIQILASKDILKQGNPRFQGLAPITMIHENNLYKYTYGECETKQEIEALLKQVKTKIPDAFIIETTRQVK